MHILLVSMLVIREIFENGRYIFYDVDLHKTMMKVLPTEHTPIGISMRVTSKSVESFGVDTQTTVKSLSFTYEFTSCHYNYVLGTHLYKCFQLCV